MNVLIVGGTGVISTAVVNEAVKQGIDVTCINRGNDHGVKPNPNVKTLHFDVRNRKVADEKLNGLHYDVVVDFICFNAVQVKYSLDLFHDKCTQYVFISTDSVYKLQKDGHYDETTPQPNPEWSYSYQKAECEKIVREYCKEHELIYTIVRPSITYGNTRIPYGLMPPYGFHYTLVERIKAGKPVVTWNGGQNLQTMMRIEDFAVGMIGLWNNKKAYNEDFNICGEVYKWSDVLDIIDEYTGTKSIRADIPVSQIIKEYPNKRGEILIDRAEDHIVSNSKLKSAVPSFIIKYTLKDGITQTLRYYETHNNVLGLDYTFDGQMDRLCCTLPENRFSDGLGGGSLSYVKYGESKSLKNYHDYLIGKYSGYVLVKLLVKVEYLYKRIAKKLFS